MERRPVGSEAAMSLRDLPLLTLALVTLSCRDPAAQSAR